MKTKQKMINTARPTKRSNILSLAVWKGKFRIPSPRGPEQNLFLIRFCPTLISYHWREFWKTFHSGYLHDFLSFIFFLSFDLGLWVYFVIFDVWQLLVMSRLSKATFLWVKFTWVKFPPGPVLLSQLVIVVTSLGRLDNLQSIDLTNPRFTPYFGSKFSGS